MLKVLSSQLILVIAVSFWASAASAIVSATLPASRSVQVDTTATIFATIINPGPEAATGCGISLATVIDAELFFQITNPVDNSLTGEPNEPVDIPPGESQSFLIGVTPGSAFAATDVAFNFSCNNTDAAPSFSGLNTLLLSSSEQPVADIVTIALTPSANGVTEVPQENGLGFFSMASVNVGATADLTLTARGPAALDGALLVCETNPQTGACLAPPAPSLPVTITGNATPTFAVFVSSFLALPFDPAGGRIFVEFTDTAGQIRGSTSVAVSGGGPDVTAVFPVDTSGNVDLPPGPAAEQVLWFLDRVRSGDVTLAEINERFDDAFDANNLLSFIANVNASHSNARVIEVVSVTPISVQLLIDNGSGGGVLSVSLQTRLADGVISGLFVPFFEDTIRTSETQALSSTEVADAFENVGQDTSLLVAQVNSAGQCVPLLERNATTLRAVGSVFKIYSLAAVASAINDGEVTLNQNLPLDSNFFAPANNILSEPPGTPLSVFDHARLMIGRSDNTATDHIHSVAGREQLDQAVLTLGHTTPDILTPLLSVNQRFSLFQVLTPTEAAIYLNASEAEQQVILQDQIEPIGSLVNNPAANLFNADILVNGTWQASPIDLCNAFTRLRTTYPVDSDAFTIINESMSTSAPFTGIRNEWDRVWFKGGSLAAGTANGPETRALAFAWFLESAERGRFVVVGAANNEFTGGINQPMTRSLLVRLLDLLAADQI